MNQNAEDLTKEIYATFTSQFGETTFPYQKITKETEYYTFDLHNYKRSGHNNCGLQTIERLCNVKIKYSQEKKLLSLERNDALTLEQIEHVYNKYNKTAKRLLIIDNTFNEKINFEEFNYIFVEKTHCYNIDNASYKLFNLEGTHKGIAFWDLETRPSERTIKLFGRDNKVLKDTILKVVYRDWRCTERKKILFTTTPDKSSVRKFQEWITHQSNNNKHYTFIAHNASRFDNYFFVANLPEIEQFHCKLSFRGLGIIKMQYKGNIFLDSCCFMPDSLSNLCKDYKVEEGKLVKFNLDGIEYTNENLCFYGGDNLDFWSFMDLKNTKPEFWKLYEEYCERDCIALQNVWEKFESNYNCILDKMFNRLHKSKSKCKLTNSTTIGSLSLKMLKETLYTNNFENYDVVKDDKGKIISSQLKQEIKDRIDLGEKDLNKQIYKNNHKKVMYFMSNDNYEYDKFDIDDNSQYDNEKIKFINNFKRGGMSVCQQRGTHLHPVVSYDITSQYPASLLYMCVPCGKSRWVNYYNKNEHGFYHLKNLNFGGVEKLRPVSFQEKYKSLQWINSDMEECYVDSFMLKRLIEKDGLLFFDVEKALVSDNYIVGKSIFNKYVNTLFDEKRIQDELKDKEDENYNASYRETIKLFLNALTGKLVENTAKYTKSDYSTNTNTFVNGIAVGKYEDPEEQHNKMVIYGVSLYSYSKRLLFEYIDPIGAENIIAIETDSIYFDEIYLDDFLNAIKFYNDNKDIHRFIDYTNYYPIAEGGLLGNIKPEVNTDKPSYFFGKKAYSVFKGNKYVSRLKGIPNNTLDEYGNKIVLVNEKILEALCNGDDCIFNFQSLVKTLFTQNKASISVSRMTREIKGEILPVYD